MYLYDILFVKERVCYCYCHNLLVNIIVVACYEIDLTTNMFYSLSLEGIIWSLRTGHATAKYI